MTIFGADSVFYGKCTVHCSKTWLT